MADYAVRGSVTVLIRTYPRFRYRAAKVKGRHPYESISGFERFVKAAGWVRKRRIIDRANDKYFELVIDDTSGVVIHHCDERLSDHFGHGSAKSADRER